MTTVRVAPYGSWVSPITADLIASAAIRLVDAQSDGQDIYWSESRPTEGGRNVIVQRGPDGSTIDLIAPPFNARTRVHEYGGAAWLVAGGIVYFSNFADQRLYRLAPGEAPRPLTPPVDLRYADMIPDRARNRLIGVREDHTDPTRQAVNTLVSLPLDGAETGGQVLVGGNDFYSSPRLSPDGARLAWLTWNHPNMPWDGAELWVGDIGADGSIAAARRVAGGPDESIFQPEWSPDGVLYYVSDRSDWWNLYRLQGQRAEAVCPLAAEFGRPQWGLGMRTYGFASARQIVCSYTQHGSWTLAELDTASGALTPYDLPYSDIDVLHVGAGQALFEGASPQQPAAIIRMDTATRQCETLRRANDTDIDPAYISTPQALEFPTENGLTAHAYFYRPANRDFVAPAEENPPLLVMTHGGPTGAASAGFSLHIQFWTSRGFAVLNVNYGGSTGYGRAYRRRLNGQWGVVDVDDAVNGARFLVARGDVDGARLAIEGGSAGGYTTLAALTFRRVFHAGASYYGVSDLESLATDTHKFESRYLDSMIGPYPQRRDLYMQRSPIHSVEQINCPLILFQGLEDKVVPPDQSERIYQAVRAKGLPVAYVAYPGEQHGFRRAENIRHSYSSQIYFFGRVFGFQPAGPIEPVAIDNSARL
ncbi:MAG: S9 family peptidase [Chloroflexi bacterium]|nr:S9 family peptidase [Chloroflexota bacterium]MCL5275938.1 S9 family peptidase [Chloroflexota bacterium]